MKSINYLQRLNQLCRQESKYYSESIDLIAASSFLRPEIVNLKYYTIHRSMEGLLGKRPYASTKYLDKIESIGVEAAKRVFRAGVVNLQPHSGSQANQAAYAAFLNPGDVVLSMKFDAGGHLTHGNPINFSGQVYHFEHYTVDPTTGLLNYDNILKIAKKIKPKMIVAGASSYPRIIDHKRFSDIAHEVGAYFMEDIAHPIGLVAAGFYPSPIPYADVVTASAEKTFWGVHAGIIMGKKEHEERINRAVHPGTQSSVPIDRIIQVAYAMLFAETKKFKQYISRVVENAKVLEKYFSQFKNCLLFGGTDCHFIVIDVWQPFGLIGSQAEKFLESLGIFTNRQVIPGEKKKVYETSGLRIGTPAATARGYTKEDFEKIVEIIGIALQNPNKKVVQEKLRKQVMSLVFKKRPLDIFN